MPLEGPTTNTEMHVIQKWVPPIPKQACLCAHTLLSRRLLFVRLLILESNASFWVSSSHPAFGIWLLLGWFAKDCAWGGGTFKLTQPFLHPALALALPFIIVAGRSQPGSGMGPGLLRKVRWEQEPHKGSSPSSSRKPSQMRLFERFQWCFVLFPPYTHPLNRAKQMVQAFLSEEAVVCVLPALRCFFWDWKQRLEVGEKMSL